MIRPITKTLLALAGTGTLAATASAQLPTTYTAGDFLVGFRQVGNSNSVVADIGPISNFNAPQIFAINLGSTLSTTFGAGWQSDASVLFSLVETDSGDNTSIVTSPQYLVGPNAGPAKVWSRLTNTNSFIFQNKVNNFGNEFTSRGTVEPMTDPNAYANFMPGGTRDAGHAGPGNISWAFFNPDTEGNFGQTTGGIVLDTIRLAPGAGPGTDLGIFQVSADGNTLSFTPSVVPEPSSYAAMAVFGALAFVGFKMNKSRKSSAQERLA